MSLVQTLVTRHQEVLSEFQYIICHWFNCSSSLSLNSITVSIHYMSLVQDAEGWIITKWIKVSIHYMSLVQRGAYDGMTSKSMFQYIICHWFN